MRSLRARVSFLLTVFLFLLYRWTSVRFLILPLSVFALVLVCFHAVFMIDLFGVRVEDGDEDGDEDIKWFWVD